MNVTGHELIAAVCWLLLCLCGGLYVAWRVGRGHLQNFRISMEDSRRLNEQLFDLFDQQLRKSRDTQSLRTDREKRLAFLEKSLAASRSELDKLSRDLKKSERQAAELSRTLALKTERISSLEEENKRGAKKILALQTQVAESVQKGTETDEHRARAERLSQSLEEMEKQLAAVRCEKEALVMANQDLTAQIQVLQSTVAEISSPEQDGPLSRKVSKLQQALDERIAEVELFKGDRARFLKRSELESKRLREIIDRLHAEKIHHEGRLTSPDSAAEGEVRADRTLGLVYLAPPECRDNLTDVQGIAASTEKKLNHLGIYCFNQIAAWTPEQVRAVERKLNLGNRIFRQQWVAQCVDLHLKRHRQPMAMAGV